MPRKIIRNIRFLCCLACCWWLAPASTYGQINSWNYSLFTTKDGLPGNAVRGTVQDKDGFLWLATDAGLCRFDGDEFLTIHNDPEDSTSIPDDVARDVSILPDGRLLVHTDMGLFVMNTHTMRGKTLRFNTSKFKDNDNYIAEVIINEKHNQVIVQTTGAFHISDLSLEHFVTIPYEFPEGNKYIGIGFSRGQLILLPSGDILFMDIISERFSYLDTRQKKIIPLREAPSNPYFSLSRCYKMECFNIDRAGNMWVYNAGIDTLLCCKPNSQLIGYPLKGAFANNFWVTELLFPDEKTMIWSFNQGDNKELCKLPYDYLMRNPGCELTTPVDKSGITGFSFSIFTDRDSNWWIASPDGLYLLKRNFTDFQRIDFKLPLANKRGTANLQLLDTDNLFIMTRFQNCYLYHNRQNVLTPIFDTLQLRNSLYNAFSRFLPLDNNRYLLAGNSNFTYQNKQISLGFQARNRFEETLLKYTGNSNFSISTIGAYFIDSKKNTWVSIEKYGLVQWNPNSQAVHYFPPDKNVVTDLFTDMTEDTDGNLWFVSWDRVALYKFDIRTRKFESIPLDPDGKLNILHPFSIESDNKGTLYIATSSAVLIYHTQKKSIKKISVKDGIPSGICGIKYYKDNLFIGSFSGMAIMNTIDCHIKMYKEKEGILEGYASGFCIDTSSNTLFLSGEQCVYKISLNTLLNPGNRAYVVIQNLMANNIGYDLTVKKSPFLHTENNISFSVSSIDFYSGINKKYFYRIILNGKASEWISNQHNKQFSFINLAPGDYTIEVRSKNADNAWSVNTAAISFSILKPWYNQGWFYALCLLTTGFVLLTVYNYRIRQIRSVERIRSKLSRDLHDDIGSTLSSINILSQMAKHNAPESSDSKTTDALEKINERSQRLLDNMSDIVWSIKPENDTLDEMLIRMRQYATGMLESKGIEYDINFPIEKIDHKLPLEVKNNIYLIFKEAVNNLCKYSDCSKAMLSFTADDRKIFIKIEDNGIGFDPEELQHRNGLNNMKHRAEEIKGKIHIAAELGKGTVIELSIKRFH